MIKRLIKKVILRIYRAGHFEYLKYLEVLRKDALGKSAIIGENTYISNDATIQNSQNDKTKIIIGTDSSIMGYLMLFKHGGEILIGDHCFIGPQSRIWSAKRIKIGNRVLIAHNVNIHDNISHPLNSIKRHEDYVHIKEKGFQVNVDLREAEIVIEDDVWIGFNSTILKGVKIGKGAIIGACSLITSDVPPYTIIVGNPQRIIKHTD